MNEAIEKSVLEIIERDAVMINFTMNLHPPSIDLSTIANPTLFRLICQIKKSYHVSVFRLFSDIKVPIYFSLIWRVHKDKLHYGIGACADLDSDTAVQKSLKECLFTYFYSKDILDLRQGNLSKIHGLYEHFLYYQNKKLFRTLFPDSEVVDYERKKISFGDVLEELSKNDLQIYYRDLTTSDISQTGIRVVRAVIPGMIDLNKSHVLPRKGAKRFRIVPHKLRFKNKLVFNPLPHPFP